MSDPQRPATPHSEPAPARARPPRMPLVWLIPIIAAAIAGWLGWRNWADQGKLVTITFATANGLTAGQTQVRHKSVALGTVTDIRLSQDMSYVIVRVRMVPDATPVLTDHAQFWIVRPRLSTRYISGLETLVSGAYIDVDPGPPGGHPKTDFKGLEEPPAMRSDEPGHSYTLTSDGGVGGLGPGSPVLYRGVSVGEVLSTSVGPEGPADMHVFVRAPYDRYVHSATRFWKEAGITINYGVQGLHLELDSLQAALAGGIEFDTPGEAIHTPMASNGTTFPLYGGKQQAIESGYRQHIPFVAYFQSSVLGLAAGSPVDLFGLDIGHVTAVRPEIASGSPPRVRVDMDIEPERLFPDAGMTWQRPLEVVQHLVDSGMRAELSTRNFITGQVAVSLEFVPGAGAAQVTRQDAAIVVPSRPGGGAGLVDAMTDIAGRLSRLPVDQIAEHLNQLLAGADQTIGSPDMRAAITSLAGTLQELHKLARQTNSSLMPALRRLPAISDELQRTMAHANQVLAGVGTSYGANSGFQRDLQRLMQQASDAARSIRLLADFLDRHPEALVRGRE